MTGMELGHMRFPATGVLLIVGVVCAMTRADGKLQPPRDYKGSLEELSQEAIIIFHGADDPGEATEDLILKIGVQGDVSHFAWIVPLPNEPETKPEDAKLFKEWSDDLWLFPYYTNRTVVPYDVRDNGPASGAWPNEQADSLASEFYDTENIPPGAWISIGIGAAVVFGTLVGITILYVRHRRANSAAK